MSNTYFNTKNYNVKIPLPNLEWKRNSSLSRANIVSYEQIILQDSL